jgi:hypothetical protein
MMGAVEELARGQQLVSKGQILGHAVAHEIGHLLMGTNSHSSRGLMRGNWKVDALHEMATWNECGLARRPCVMSSDGASAQAVPNSTKK